MSIKQSYNEWSEQYDTNVNRTRDVEATALQTVLAGSTFSSILEVGCGTGKNTVFLQTITTRLLAVDFSEAMLAKAREKITHPQVQFHQADINQEWNFTNDRFSLITFSLVLEHIENLDFIFSEVQQKLQPGGQVYIGELHPLKQYNGSGARFDAATGRQELQCYTHHISDFVQLAQNYGLRLMNLMEFFDNDDRTTLPRILTLLFERI